MSTDKRVAVVTGATQGLGLALVEALAKRMNPADAVYLTGRNYDRMPVNANEAEARRRARFFPIGHSPGETPEPRPLDNPEHPLTLDLRRT